MDPRKINIKNVKDYQKTVEDCQKIVEDSVNGLFLQKHAKCVFQANL